MIITAKTHLYIKIRSYASKYLMDKDNWQDNKIARDAHQQAAKDYLDFFGTLIDKFSGVTMKKLFNDYLSAYDVAEEYLYDATGVKIAKAEAYYIYCIPKTELGAEIYNWILDNCNCKEFKVIKKTRGSYNDYGITTFYRDNYKRDHKRYEKL